MSWLAWFGRAIWHWLYPPAHRYVRMHLVGDIAMLTCRLCGRSVVKPEKKEDT